MLFHVLSRPNKCFGREFLHYYRAFHFDKNSKSQLVFLFFNVTFIIIILLNKILGETMRLCNSNSLIELIFLPNLILIEYELSQKCGYIKALKTYSCRVDNKLMDSNCKYCIPKTQTNPDSFVVSHNPLIFVIDISDLPHQDHHT